MNNGMRDLSKTTVSVRHVAAVYFPEAYTKAIHIAFPVVRLSFKNLSPTKNITFFNIFCFHNYEKGIILPYIPLEPCSREFQFHPSCLEGSEPRL